MNISIIALHAPIYCGLLTIALGIMALKNPRLMLQDYPKSIQNDTAPKTPKEKRQGVWFGLPFLLILIGYPMGLGLYVANNNIQYWEVFSTVYVLLLAGNVYDLFILDWLIICFITPKLVVIPGTEGNKGYKDYKFHLIGFLKGIVITLILAIVLSEIAILLV